MRIGQQKNYYHWLLPLGSYLLFLSCSVSTPNSLIMLVSRRTIFFQPKGFD
ncbi:hypothetical protein DB41_IJ00380 [Neochlamydia sp. TUME1]|nr:hypothetical protein DB41_IJ00380 [Neochlamydia sp. TUME1]